MGRVQRYEHQVSEVGSFERKVIPTGIQLDKDTPVGLLVKSVEFDTEHVGLDGTTNQAAVQTELGWSTEDSGSPAAVAVVSRDRGWVSNTNNADAGGLDAVAKYNHGVKSMEGSVYAAPYLVIISFSPTGIAEPGQNSRVILETERVELPFEAQLGLWDSIDQAEDRSQYRLALTPEEAEDRWGGADGLVIP